MTVYIGNVETFKNIEPDKEQALKPLEEAAEVFGAWQKWHEVRSADKNSFAPDEARCLHDLLYECADVVQAVCNLVDSLGESAFEGFIKECADINRARGRM